jgi:hypothetical protein
LDDLREPHSFKNESDRAAKVLIMVAPAGLEQMLFEIGTALEQGATTTPSPSRQEIDKLLKLAPSYGIEILLP